METQVKRCWCLRLLGRAAEEKLRVIPLKKGQMSGLGFH